MEAEELYGVLLKTIQETLAGIGVIRGTPCMLSNVEETDIDILLTFEWEETDGTRHEQDVLVPKISSTYKSGEHKIGKWIDGNDLYRQVIEITDPNSIQKGVLLKVMDLPEDFIMLTNSIGIIKTYEGSYSNNDILIYSTTNAIMAKQNFTGYPQKLTIIIEYTKRS